MPDVGDSNDDKKCNGCHKSSEESLVERKKFSEIISCSAQTQSRTERIKILVRSAVKYLDVKGLLWETGRAGCTEITVCRRWSTVVTGRNISFVKAKQQDIIWKEEEWANTLGSNFSVLNL